MAVEKVLFGLGLVPGAGDVSALVRHAIQADREGLDLVCVPDHPYRADRLDAYAALGFILGGTTNIAGAVTVTSLPTRPAPMLARTITALSALSGGRVVFGIGAGGYWHEIVKLGIQELTPASAVRAMEEAITLVQALSGGGTDPVDFDGEFYQVAGLVPAPVPTPPIWTGALGPKSLAATGRLADGWIPGRAADWRSPRVAESRPIIDEAAEAAGRDPVEIATIYNLPARITAKPLEATRNDDGRWIGGSVKQWIDELTTAVLEYRATGFVYFPATDGTPSDVEVSRWAREIVPAIREALRQAHE